MPAISIDTFFACTLLVSVALLATASFVGAMQSRIIEVQEINEEAFINTIANNLISSYGTPIDWASNKNLVPTTFGFSDTNSLIPYGLDIDLISRLNQKNLYSLSYIQVLKSAQLNDIALGISASQMFSVQISLFSNETFEDLTNYTFKIKTDQESVPISTNLQCYVTLNDIIFETTNTTSQTGIGYVTFQIPNSQKGTALLVVFGRTIFDDRLTCYETYSFAHLSDEPLPNNTFLKASPLNYELSYATEFTDLVIRSSYAFSYTQHFELTLISDSAYSIPHLADKSPIVLVISGSKGNLSFIEWVSYPDIPLEFGSDFRGTEENVFSYIVRIEEVLYRLNLKIGELNK